MKLGNNNRLRIQGKLAFIVGGSGLIGNEIVKTFLKEGAKVVILDVCKNIDFKKINSEYEHRCHYHFFDCKKLSLIEKYIFSLCKKYGCPDIFVNSSYPKTRDWVSNNFDKIKLSSYKKNIDFFLNSNVWIAKTIALVMKKRNIKGSIIFLGSIYGKVGQDRNMYLGTNMRENMTYSVIKGGIDSMVRQMASYFGKYKIRVNNLCPGALNSHVAGLAPIQSKRFIKNFISKNPIKRLGTAEEISYAALFLASDESSYVTGASIYVDGGYTSV